ncbi:Clan ME, family M16, insulinase-like metallopeptidase [Tritrichomonas foetus]|uniref:Clan ME, family M16, insulinase-like metallopeptidase n=1 Tax=Tritrichomonas foetus TaxID=1144522 RepID=A0A1J4J5L7_9EUKA|nr:Clan ME, family M16, insulinase-like metallopeptidase [Tritrichomonas foetus]|eukprot:OHS94530.1 Clan ME, family M16, insulinase-like metallopeptidase [Tritrichomonas foetus]
MRNSEFLPNADNRPLSYFAKLTAYTVPILMLVASIYAFEKTTDPQRDIRHGFILKEKHKFPSMNIEAYLYENVRFKCPFLYISTPDTHNFFSTTFRTTPSDNSGAIHVLQHLITQSSENYPIRSLFQELKKRSFATLLTSYSSHEWTAFPFSTTNSNDFDNILDVYLDAIFHPLINNETFYSECHRLEFEDPYDYRTPLHHDGTVYNEVHEETLKSNSRFSNLLQENLFPDSLFKNKYYGTPSDISKLTISSLKQYHFRYFHPMNSLFFFYGSIPVDLLLSHVSNAINSFPVTQPPSDDQLYNQAKWKNPHHVEFNGQLDDNSRPEKIRAAVAWMCGDLRNISDIIDLEFLSVLLTHSTVSPLYHGLIKTDVGTKFLETGYFPIIRSPYFSIGVEGFNPTFMSFNQTVLALLKQLYKKGFDSNRVKSLLNRHEIRQKSIAASQGLKIWKSIIGSWIHNVSPFELIDPSWEIERLKKLLSVQPRYFEMIMKQKLINNKHRIDISMHGLEDFNEELIKNEKVKLKILKNNMTVSEKTNIINIAKLLDNYKNQPKPLNLLPSIKVSDLQPFKQINDPTVLNNVYLYESKVNGIVYIEIKGQLPLDNDYIEDIPLLKAVLNGVGAGDLDENDFSTNEQLYTGGLKCEFSIKPGSKYNENPQSADAYFIIKGSALSRNIDRLFSLMEKMLMDPWLNNTEQIAVLISMLAATSEEKSSVSGSDFVSRYSSAGFSKAAALDELLQGFTAVHRISHLVRSNDWSAVSVRIQKVYKHVFRMANFTALVHCDNYDQEEVQFMTEELLSKLNQHNYKPKGSDKAQEFYEEVSKKSKILITSDSPSYYSCLALKGPTFNETYSAAFSVATSIIHSEFLIPEIYEKKSLGIIHSTYDPFFGIVTFSTTKDKNPSQIFQIIEDSINLVAKGSISNEIIENSIIHLASKMDSPTSPSEEGILNFLYGISSKQQLERRQKILKVTVSDVIYAANLMKKSEKRYSIYGLNQESMIPPGFDLFEMSIDDTNLLDN